MRYVDQWEGVYCHAHGKERARSQKLVFVIWRVAWRLWMLEPHRGRSDKRVGIS